MNPYEMNKVMKKTKEWRKGALSPLRKKDTLNPVVITKRHQDSNAVIVKRE